MGETGPVDRSETVRYRFGSEAITGVPVWQADFDHPEQMITVTEAGGEWRFTGDELHVETRGERAGYCWCPEPMPEDLLIGYEAWIPEWNRVSTRGDPEWNARNLNCMFATTAPEGGEREVLEMYRATEDVPSSGELRNYFFSLTPGHCRLRKNPGRDLKSELPLGIGETAIGESFPYQIALLKQGGRIRAAVNGRLVHDWIDPTPYDGGLVGLVTWQTHAVVTDWGIYQPVAVETAPSRVTHSSS